MNGIRPKVARLQLDTVSYEALRQQVLRRDGWRCQSCGAMSNLEVHHKEFRSLPVQQLIDSLSWFDGSLQPGPRSFARQAF